MSSDSAQGGDVLGLRWTGLAVAAAILLSAADPCFAQGSGVSLGLHGGVDAMFGDDSGPGGEVVAGYRWDSGVELLAGTGLKLGFSFGSGPDDAGGGSSSVETDHVHHFAEMRFWPWKPDDGIGFPAGYFGFRAGTVSKRGGGFDAEGTAVGVTGGMEFELTQTLGLSTSLILDFVGIGRDESLRSSSFNSWRAGLRVGMRALLGGG